MESNNSIDINELPTNRPIYWNLGNINLPDDFVKKFEDYFSDDKLSKLLASFPSVDIYTQSLLDAEFSYGEIEKYEFLNGKNDKSNLEVSNRKILLAQYRLSCFNHCNSFRKLFLDYKKAVEILIREGVNEKNLEEIAKMEKEIHKKISNLKFLKYDKMKNLAPKYYETFSKNYQFLVGNAEESLSSLNEIKGDTADFCTKIYNYILVYKEIKDAYLYIEYLIIMPSICQLLENFSFENNVKGLLTE